VRHDTVVIRRRHRHATAASNDFFCVPFGGRANGRVSTPPTPSCDDGGPAPSTQTAPTAPTARTAAERVSGIIFVVDAADASRFDEARQELHKLLSEPRLRGVPLLVLANKMDLPEVEAALGVAERDPRPDGARCAVQGACSLCGDGVVAALEW
jgi:hypothetical protein